MELISMRENKIFIFGWIIPLKSGLIPLKWEISSDLCSARSSALKSVSVSDSESLKSENSLPLLMVTGKVEAGTWLMIKLNCSWLRPAKCSAYDVLSVITRKLNQWEIKWHDICKYRVSYNGVLSDLSVWFFHCG